MSLSARAIATQGLGFTPRLISVQGLYPATETRQQPAGRGGKKRRVVVEIDGQDVLVGSTEEAKALIAKVREEAEETAALAIKRAANVSKRPLRKVIADARKTLQIPLLDVRGDSDLQSFAMLMLGDISALYRSTLETIEIGALLRKREQEDEEDAILLMMML